MHTTSRRRAAQRPLRTVRHAGLLVAALAASLAACSDSNDTLLAPPSSPPAGPPAAPPVDQPNAPPLSVAEARDVVTALATVSSVDLTFLLRDAQQGEARSSLMDVFADTVPCPAGGTLLVRGALDFDEGGLASFDVRDDHRGCGTAVGGATWTFDAALPIHTYMVLRDPATPDAPWLEGFIIGAVRFVRGTHEGQCSFAVMLAGVGDAVVPTGTVCGHAIAALRAAD